MPSPAAEHTPRPRAVWDQVCCQHMTLHPTGRPPSTWIHLSSSLNHTAGLAHPTLGFIVHPTHGQSCPRSAASSGCRRLGQVMHWHPVKLRGPRRAQGAHSGPQTVSTILPGCTGASIATSM